MQLYELNALSNRSNSTDKNHSLWHAEFPLVLFFLLLVLCINFVFMYHLNRSNQHIENQLKNLDLTVESYKGNVGATVENAMHNALVDVTDILIANPPNVAVDLNIPDSFSLVAPEQGISVNMATNSDNLLAEINDSKESILSVIDEYIVDSSYNDKVRRTETFRVQWSLREIQERLEELERNYSREVAASQDAALSIDNIHTLLRRREFPNGVRIPIPR